ncbi:MAG: DNA-3-methyladenine glycosylase I [Armatimonadetes bacterium]|nr:DNA-3-methyladenine glycosylase I [Armatimonadota bacterium]
MQRCSWAQKELDVKYHDEEWGVPQFDEIRLFEKLCLEGAQAGLNWSLILARREEYRRVFKGFQLEPVLSITEAEVEDILINSGIVRNRAKVLSVISNARAVAALHERGTTLKDFLWDFVDGQPIQNEWTTLGQIPATTAISDAMSKALKNQGFKFCGSTICYSLMQACGLVNDHAVSCFRYEVIRNWSATSQR